ncbi:MAG: site-specific DNA-methyltransferase [Chitinispirillia bacterium]|nr:site-specific DNA-methyltransferase [Chitinispirillia bacterium]MCL2268154.1 site-specific DNA-methyltransferase [Chitinispirillia bacterium]
MNLLFEQYSIADYYNNISDAILLEGDTLDIVKKLPQNEFKLLVSSPPYNIGKVYEKEVNLNQYIEWQESIISELFRICHLNGSIVWQVGNYVDKGEIFPLDIYFYPIFKKMGFKLRNRIIWHFGHGLHASKRFSGRYEVLLWFTKCDEYTFNLDNVRIPSKYPGKRNYKGNNIGKPSGNPLGKNPSDFWEIITGEWNEGIINIPNVKSNHPEKTEHPCSFPIELIERCVLALTNENDYILDPFGGVGSSLIAALKNKRRGVTIDKEKIYLNITKERIAKLEEGSLKTRKIGTPIFVPTGREKVSQIPIEWVNNN